MLQPPYQWQARQHGRDQRYRLNFRLMEPMITVTTLSEVAATSRQQSAECGIVYDGLAL